MKTENIDEKLNLGVLSEVAKERMRQIGKGFDAAHDDRYVRNELLRAAIAYADHDDTPGPFESILGMKKGAPFGWPWDERWWRPEGKRKNLIKATALLLAEIEKMDRKAARELSPEKTGENGVSP